MRVINIEKLKNRKNKVILDNGEILYLYNSEIIKLGLDIDSNIDDDLYEVIIRDYIFARAKKKALAILERSMNSVYQIRTKLKRADYSDKVIDDVIHFLEYYNFVDDYLYGKMYIESNRARKSTMELKMELKKRGIDSSIVKELLDHTDDEYELQAIKKYIKKYQNADGSIPEEKKIKALSALYRKGFSKNLINKVIDVDYE